MAGNPQGQRVLAAPYTNEEARSAQKESQYAFTNLGRSVV